MSKPHRLYHLWLATALAGTAGLSLTTYSERVLVPQGFAPAGLVAPETPPPGGRAAAGAGPERRGAPLPAGAAMTAAPGVAADRSAARRMIGRQPGEGAEQHQVSGPDGPGLGYTQVDPATREMRRLLAMGGGPALPLYITNGQERPQAGTVRTTALPSSIVPRPGPGAGPTDSPHGDPTTVPSGSPSAAPTGSPTGAPGAVPSSGPSSPPTGVQSPEPVPGPGPKPEPAAEPGTGPTTGPTSGPGGTPSPGASPHQSDAPGETPPPSPAAGPTAGPTSGPTNGPVVTPTAEPSAGPTLGFVPDPVITPGTGTPPGTEPAPVDVAAAVPEPSTWLMLLLGLGVLGHALRTGRRLGSGTDPEAEVRT